MSLLLAMSLIFVCAFVAFSLSGICGGGAGLLMMPILGIVAPVVQVPAILSIGTSSSSVSCTAAFFSQIQWNVVKWFGVTLVLAGVQFLTFGIIAELVMRVFYESQHKMTYNIREVCDFSARTEASTIVRR